MEPLNKEGGLIKRGKAFKSSFMQGPLPPIKTLANQSIRSKFRQRVDKFGDKFRDTQRYQSQGDIFGDEDDENYIPIVFIGDHPFDSEELSANFTAIGSSQDEVVALLKKVFQNKYPITRSHGIPRVPALEIDKTLLIDSLKFYFDKIRENIIEKRKTMGNSTSLRENIEHLQKIKSLIEHFIEAKESFPYHMFTDYLDNQAYVDIEGDYIESFQRINQNKDDEARIKNLLRQFAKVYLENKKGKSFELYDPGVGKDQFNNYRKTASLPVILQNMIHMLDRTKGNISDADNKEFLAEIAKLKERFDTITGVNEEYGQSGGVLKSEEDTIIKLINDILDEYEDLKKSYDKIAYSDNPIILEDQTKIGNNNAYIRVKKKIKHLQKMVNDYKDKKDDVTKYISEGKIKIGKSKPKYNELIHKFTNAEIKDAENAENYENAENAAIYKAAFLNAKKSYEANAPTSATPPNPPTTPNPQPNPQTNAPTTPTPVAAANERALAIDHEEETPPQSENRGWGTAAEANAPTSAAPPNPQPNPPTTPTPVAADDVKPWAYIVDKVNEENNIVNEEKVDNNIRNLFEGGAKNDKLHDYCIKIANNRLNKFLTKEPLPFFSLIEEFENKTKMDVVKSVNQQYIFESFLNYMLNTHFETDTSKEFFHEAQELLKDTKKEYYDIINLSFVMLEVCNAIQEYNHKHKDMDVVRMKSDKYNAIFDSFEQKIKNTNYDFYTNAPDSTISITYYNNHIYFYRNTNEFINTYSINDNLEINKEHYDFNEEVYHINDKVIYLFFIITNYLYMKDNKGNTKQLDAEKGLKSFSRKLKYAKRKHSKSLQKVLEEKKQFNKEEIDE